MEIFQQCVQADCLQETIQEVYTNPLLLGEKVAGDWDTKVWFTKQE